MAGRESAPLASPDEGVWGYVIPVGLHDSGGAIPATVRQNCWRSRKRYGYGNCGNSKRASLVADAAGHGPGGHVRVLRGIGAGGAVLRHSAELYAFSGGAGAGVFASPKSHGGARQRGCAAGAALW